MAKNKAQDEDGTSLIAKNKKAFHNYEVMQQLECGIALTGTEVKSLRMKNLAFTDCYATVREGELVLVGLNISEYAMGHEMNHVPDRNRKLLVKKREIRKLKTAVQEKGLTLVPLDLHWRRGLAKVELGLVRGKKLYDKRETLRDRETKRDQDRARRQYGR
jgi:SsrA-binding protein